MPAGITYALVRLGIFGAIFAPLVLVGISWWIAALFGTIISLAAGYIFFPHLRHEVAGSLQHRFERGRQARRSDAEAEDGF